MIRVLVADDEPMVCHHLRTILGASPDLEVIAEAHNGAAAVDGVVAMRPDVVLMDLRMPGVDGLTAIRRIAALPDPPVQIALTTFDADHYVVRALRSGAIGFLLKSTPAEELAALVMVAAAGHSVLSPEANRALVARADGPWTERERLLGGLTEREVDVLACLGDGLSNAQVADRLHLSETTVKGYVSRVLEKLGFANRTQAGLFASELGLAR